MLNPILCCLSSSLAWAISAKESTDKHIDYAKNNQSKFHVDDKWFKYIPEDFRVQNTNTIFAMWPIIPACYQTVEMLNYKYVIDSCDIAKVGQPVSHISSVECSYTYNNKIMQFSSHENDSCDTRTTMISMFVCCFFFYPLFFGLLHSNYVFIKYSLKLMGVNARIVARSCFSYFLVLYYIIIVGLIGSARYFANSQTCLRFVDPIEIDFNRVLSQGNAWVGVFQFVLLYSCILSLLLKQIQDPWLAYVKFSDFVHKVQYLDYPLHAIDFEINGDLQSIQRILRLYYERYKRDEDEKIILCAAVNHLVE